VTQTTNPILAPLPRPTQNADQEPLIWGLSVRELHDLFWAARGIQVVRPGTPHDPRGPGIFLLLTHEECVLAHAKPWLKRLTWSGCRTLRIHLTDRSQNEYRERVVTSPEGEFVRIDRVYPRREGHPGRAVLTTDPKVARAWSGLTPGRERWRDLPEPSKRHNRGAWASEARLFDLSRPAWRTELLRALVREWREPGRIIPSIYQLKPGIWAHESVRELPKARLIAPVWIGASPALEDTAPVLGPRVINDSRPCDPPPEIDWESLRFPASPLLPRVRTTLSRRVSKRAFDIVMSAGALLATLPIYPIVMLAIYLEDGRPFFFAHKRQTLGGRDFPCWKFRTMIKNAERLKAQLAAQNVCDGPQFFISRDPRLLKCGRLLRRLQVDELPQFWNVLLGHMSVVGPRPSPDKENQFCPAWREARLSVRPGITGLWQVRRTRLPETDFQEWIRYDLEYVQHQSWRMDIWIIFETIRRIIGG
jgi:lipopolysaccharide/colanic/teichoic acid biosynthesis glycosyltransferase